MTRKPWWQPTDTRQARDLLAACRYLQKAQNRMWRQCDYPEDGERSPIDELLDEFDELTTKLHGVLRHVREHGDYPTSHAETTKWIVGRHHVPDRKADGAPVECEGFRVACERLVDVMQCAENAISPDGEYTDEQDAEVAALEDAMQHLLDVREREKGGKEYGQEYSRTIGEWRYWISRPYTW